MSHAPLAELSDASVTYRGRFQALSDVDLAIQPGERLAVVGGSGSGKTTLARLLLGLVPPSRGDVRFQGRSIVGLRESRRGWLRASASMVFQDPNSSLNPRMRLREIVLEPLRSQWVRGQPGVPEPSRAVAAAALGGVDLDEELLNRFPHQLSGGQRQRLAIARALISEPSLLVADEPVSALDVSVRSQVLRVLGDQVTERGVALVLISHDLLVVRNLCDRVIVLERGRIVEQGPVADVLDSPNHPYTRALVEATLTL